MSQSFHLSVPHDVIVQRALDFFALGVSRQTVLAEADQDLTVLWWTALKADAAAAQLLPSYGQLRAADSQLTITRNAYIAEARPLLQDLYYYAKKAYPTDAHPGNYFGQMNYTKAGSNPLKVAGVLHDAVSVFPARRAALETAGMKVASLDRLEELSVLTQTSTTAAHAAQGETSVETDQHAFEFEGIWARCSQVAAAAGVAYRGNEAERKLFLLVPGSLEQRGLTVPPAALPVPPAPAGTPAVRALVLASVLSADRLLSISIESTGEAVRVLLQTPNSPFSPDSGMLLTPTEKNKPHHCTAAALGWLQPGNQELVAINPTDKKVHLTVRVLAVGE